MNESAPKQFLLLGGYGFAGRQVAELLLRSTDNVRLTLAGRNLTRAEALAQDLNARFDGDRVLAACVDASNPHNLQSAFCAVDMVLVLSSTSKYTEQVAEAALQANIDYYDILDSPENLTALQKLDHKIRDSGHYFITGGGFRPGLPATMIRRAASKFDELKTAMVGSIVRIDWKSLELSDSTWEEFGGKFVIENLDNFHYEDMFTSGGTEMDFGDQVGRQEVTHVSLEELQHLPDLIPTLQQVGFYIGTLSNWFVDLVLPLSLFPFMLLLLAMFPNRGQLQIGK